ncbi:MAG: radical SAM peptide maturase, CXXX-repeat target family [Candidatus Aminicenantes bacterium]|nr:radical SAM peptide maturase, CXXX-repeat target family [Candidatus Aminicenantes bacterium]
MQNEMNDRTDKYYSRLIQREKRMKLPSRELSFFVTADCTLACDYCYLPGKNTNTRMPFEVAKKAVDYFVANSPKIFTEQRLILDFIGGEPLMEIDLMDQVVDYFKVLTYKQKHHWFNNYRIMMTTNGTLCKSKKFERFLEKNLENIFVAISLDGTKEKHDRSRKYKGTGKGSYDDVIEGCRFVRERTANTNVKATFSSEDLKYLKDSVLHLHSILKDTEFFANVIYENVWKEGDDKLFESQLVDLADHIIDHDLYEDINVSFFSEYDTLGRPYHQSQLDGHWCNTGHQVIVGPDGAFYPCNRFIEYSLFNQKGRVIGNVNEGINFDKLRPFRVINLGNCSDAECIGCDVAVGCGMCSGLSYDDSEVGTIFNRTKFICKMHKARTRAHRYYWNRLANEKNYKKEKTHFYISQIQAPRKVLNVLLSSGSPRICGYPTGKAKTETIDLTVLKENLRLCRDNNYFVNILYPSTPLDDRYLELLAGIDAQKTIPYSRQSVQYKLEDSVVFTVTLGQELHPGFSCMNMILLADLHAISSLGDYVEGLFKKNNITRINLVFDLNEISIDFDFDTYKAQLNKIATVLFDCYKSNQPRYLNVLTDIFVLEKMNNCSAGITHITLGPDGKRYICPAFYYSGQALESSDFTPPHRLTRQLDFKSAAVCKACDALHCRRCVFDNFNKTDEYNIPGEVQCIISHIEREASLDLQNRLLKETTFNSFKNILTEKDYIDPFTNAKLW